MPPRRPSRNPKLGQFIRQARQAKGLSLVKLQKLSGVEQSTIYYLEQGTFASPDPAKLVKLARALDLDLEELYGLAGYLLPEAKRLPELGPYLRAKYDLSPAEIKELKARLNELHAKRTSESKSARKAKS